MAALVLGVLVLLLGWGTLITGGLTLTANAMVRDGSGYVMSDAAGWSSPGYAVQSEGVEVTSGPLGFGLPHRLLGRFRATAVPTGGDGVFVGVASSQDVARYLRDVARTTVRDPFSDTTTSRFVDGGSPRVAPTDAGFWVASASGAGPQEITWDPRPGSWRLVVMNAEGTTPVAADVAVGAEAPGLRRLGWGLVAGGLLLLGAAGAVVLVSLGRT
ncbi:MAG TPA: hypothetical protein VFT70_06315 [Nocardioides sp.]|nr:hypothetical protein [Nocardioides sp.]